MLSGAMSTMCLNFMVIGAMVCSPEPAKGTPQFPNLLKVVRGTPHS